ncbi:stage II sporulation protein M [Paenibacillus sp. D2_2]|uniref:stage II sporulation protein M n=1 Tax=Paenibacillus sp. D2_2 TaxID=3073092 RepID=UPI002814FEFF|nr:stage II sporulation protein M [Paenibacillus sp. D2_2]WMT40512.1 stage II sporulation protein M [Paenibacillus sp. D2_2]
MLSFRLFMRDLRKYKKSLMVSIAFFAVGILMGAIETERIANLVMTDIETLRNYSKQLSESAVPELSFFRFIFMNNVIKSLGVIVLGALFGIFPAVFLLMNGLILGFLVTSSAQHGANLFDLIVKGLLPHGIIEIPAIIMAAAFGIQFGYNVLKGLGELGARDRNERTIVWRDFFISLIRAAFWTVVLLLIAAVIESTLTFYLVR